MNKPGEALACFEACWSESARLPALFGKAVALQLLRRFDEAEVLYGRTLEIEPRSAESLGFVAMSMEFSIYLEFSATRCAWWVWIRSPRCVASAHAGCVRAPGL